MSWEDKPKEIKSSGERAWSWWSGWLALGLAVGATELLANAFFGRFPVFVFLGTEPLVAVPLGALSETLFWAAIALGIGGLTELVRRVFGGALSWHLGVRVGTLLSLEVCVVKLLATINYREGLFKELLADPDQFLEKSSTLLIQGGIFLAILFVTVWFSRTRRAAESSVVARDELGLLLFASVLGAVYPFAYNRGMAVANWPLPSVKAGVAVILLLATSVGVIAYRRRLPVLRLAFYLQIPALATAVALTAWYSWPASYSRPNIIVSLWDTARVPFDGYERETITPFLGKLASQGVDFVNAYSPANFTYASHVSLFTGKSYREHNLHIGFGRDARLYQDEFTLQRKLRTLGYYTVLFTENGWVLAAEAGSQEVRYFERMSVTYTGRNEAYPQGCCSFERPPSIYSYSSPFLGRWLLDSARYLFDGFYTHTLDRIEFRHIQELFLRSRRIGPIFLFWNLMNVHDRYHPYGIWQANSTVFDYDLQKEYILGLRYADERLKELYGLIVKSGLLENTVLIITSDHGEFLGEYGMNGHHKALFEQVIKVPLAVVHPDLKPGKVFSSVSLTDFRWLIEKLAEGPDSNKTEEVEEVMTRSEWVIAEHATLSEEWGLTIPIWSYTVIYDNFFQYIHDSTLDRSAGTRPQEEFAFLFPTTDNTEEKENRIDLEPDFIADLFRDYYNDYLKTIPTDQAVAYSNEDRENILRSLGYLQ